eukprot:TRINITY_DN3621_c0_g1_i3.p1 TRINITY_DN3621_c0_g1~~TRINITY_DN3621_c0_g1_i3.p1  ORF type:complete len:418 (+),score=19.00 TRINITY_DN3621_c0_g1_i3:182-1435(+)
MSIWIYEKAGRSVTLFGLSNFMVHFPGLVMTPFGGWVADKYDRKRIMIISDLISVLCTVGICYKLYFDELEIWHIYICDTIMGVCGSFQSPAFESSISQIVSPQNLQRANGMIQIAFGLAQLLCPALSGVLMSSIGIEKIILIDILTCSFAVLTLIIVTYPPPQKSEEGKEADKEPLAQQLSFGLRYIFKNKALVALLSLFALSNFTTSFITVLMTPLLMGIASVYEVGLVSSFAGCGVLFGSIFTSMYDTPQNLLNGIIPPLFLQGLFMLSAFGPIDLYLLGSVGFLYMFLDPIIMAATDTLWQETVPEDIQGRVFAFRSLFATFPMPLGQLIAGPLADNYFEPLMNDASMENTILGYLLGIGPGRGICFIFIILGLSLMIGSIAAFFYQPLLDFVQSRTKKTMEPAVVEESKKIK